MMFLSKLFQYVAIVLIVAAIYLFSKAKKEKTANEEANSAKYKKGAWVSVVCGAIAFALCLVFISKAPTPTKKEVAEEWKTKDNSTMAYIMMQDFVKDRLKSPTSAKFPWAHEDAVKITKTEFQYYINAYADSQNSFGAMVRTKFNGLIEQESKDNWVLRFLDMDDQRAYLDWKWLREKGYGKIAADIFYDSFRQGINYFVSEGAEKYLDLDDSKNPFVIHTDKIGKYTIELNLTDDLKFIKGISFSYRYNGTKYQDDMSNKIFLTLIYAAEPFNTEEETHNLLREVYRNETEEAISLIGHKYTQKINGDDFLYNVEIFKE